MNYRFAKLNGLNFYKLLKNVLISGKRDALLIPETTFVKKYFSCGDLDRKKYFFQDEN